MVIAWLGVFAHAVEARLQLDVARLEVGQSTAMRIHVIDGRPQTAPPVHVPEGLSVRFVSGGSSFRSGPGGFTEIRTFEYELTALEAGSHTVGPFSVAVGGSAVETGASPVLVTPRLERGSDPLRVEARFEPSQIVEGQVTIYRARLEARGAEPEVRWRLPALNGLRLPQGAETREERSAIQDPSGRIGVREAIVPVVPTGVGTLSVGPALAELAVRTGRLDFFGFGATRRQALPTTAAELVVVPLPSPQPEGFSGLVGDFVVRSRVDRTEVAVGDSVTWIVDLLGNGLVDSVKPPALADGPSWRVYPGEVQTGGAYVEGGWEGRATLRLAIVPTAPGVLDLPDGALVVYSPKAGDYVTLDLPLPALQVEGVAVAAEMESFATAPRIQKDEVVDPWPPASAWGTMTTLSFDRAVPALLLGSAIPGALAAVRSLAGLWRRRPVRSDPVLTRASQLFASLPMEPASRIEALDRILRLALARRVPGTLDRDTAIATLAEPGRSLVGRAGELLDRVRVAGLDGDPEAAVRDAVGWLEGP